MNGTFHRILEALDRVVRFDLAAVLSLEASGKLRVLAARGPLASHRLDNHLVDPEPRSALRAALAGAAPRLLSEEHHGEPDTYAEVVSLPGDHSCLVAPLRHDGELLGAITVDAMSCGVFGVDTVRAVEAFAYLAAVAIAEERRADRLSRSLDSLAAENLTLRGERGEVRLVGSSPAWRAAVERIRLVAPTPVAALVTGESGTGKELAARAIHQWSSRRGGPFIALNCSALSPELALSEMFGHERGAFTGADRRRAGRFELADGGTLFLDEVADLPASVQPQLLRVLQERTFERVGGSETIVVDVRLVAATNRDLAAAVRGGSFREDLYYRLSTFPIHLPPLRERAADVALLAAHFVAECRPRLEMPRLRLAEATVRALEARPWPGNVRELAGAIERGAILAGGGVIEPRHIEADGAASRPRAPAAPAMVAGFAMPEGLSRLDAALAREILAAIAEGGGKVGGRDGAAAALGVPATTLHSAIHRLGLKVRR